ncbi:MAG: hypothetical protein EHM34_08870 [Nitrosopumilales archaeon]|nr:MAG: hypothetical protein EHM34_08870 [Nitrosopumilales archaeon]
MIDIAKIYAYANKAYNDANCTYGDGSYMIHINMVMQQFNRISAVFKKPADIDVTLGAVPCHDLIEDAKQTHNDICKVCGKDVADVTLAVTDVPAENRLLRHLLTMPKTVRDYRAIILKMCDMHANASFSKANGSSMYRKYVREYQYRKPIFQMALEWYVDELNLDVLQEFWNELDELHGKTK